MTTQYANASYQEIIDLHTESTSVSIVGIHTPCSDTPYHMLKGFWDQFKKFKYNGCSITMVPSATLPVDPLQVSYDASEPTIDPRDTLNPIMFHGCHGDDMGAILNALYSEPVSGAGQLIESELGDSVDHNKILTGSGSSVIATKEFYEALYYRALTDKTWLKAHPQKGFRKTGLHPMIYSVASTVQMGVNGGASTYIMPYDNVHNDTTGAVTRQTGGVLGTAANSGTVQTREGYGRPAIVSNGDNTFSVQEPVSRSMTGFLTPRLQKLGWMDTRQVIGIGSAVKSDVDDMTSSDSVVDALTDMYFNASKNLKPVLTPKIFMCMIMLPPAYKTMQHFRLILNHSFSFAKFRGASMQYDNPGEIRQAYPYFNFSGTDADKKIDPVPEPKEDEKNGQ